jgi:hypothetical protein
VLAHWLDEQLGTEDFDRLVDRDPAVWSAIHVLTGLLDDDPIIFSPDYGKQLAAARARLRDRLGEEFVVGRSPTTGDRGPSEETLIVRGAGEQQWILSPPIDPYGDGYVAHLPVGLHDEGLHAQTTVTIDGYATQSPGDLASYMQQLADDWRGWSDRRIWHAVEREMTIEATHDGRGHVTLEVTVRRHRRPYANDAWSATTALALEAGEQMTTVARDIRAILTPPRLSSDG